MGQVLLSDAQLAQILAPIYTVTKIIIASGILSFIAYFAALKFFSKSSERKTAKRRAYACLQLSFVLCIAILAYIFYLP
jgi:hypothetical protein